MLEKNENLGWRDVQYILIQNTIKNDANDQDWSLNGAGYHVNHKYGFGMVDAFNSVISAELWVNVAKFLFSFFFSLLFYFFFKGFFFFFFIIY